MRCLNFVVSLTVIASVSLSATISQARMSKKAAPEEVYEMVVRGASVLSAMGEEGLKAFMDPEGEFVWKDTYVFVYNCGAGVPAAHPFAHHVVGVKMETLKDGPKHIFYKVFRKLCDAADEQGKWVEYMWPVEGEGLKRKISFIVQVPGRPYQVVSGIYDEKLDIEELNKGIR